MQLTLDTSVQYIPRVGPHMAALLSKLGIITVRDFLYDAPFRYNDYSHTIPIRQARVGTTICIRGTVQSLKNVFTKNGKKMQEGVVADATGKITVIWFNQIYLPKTILPGDEVSLAGTVEFFGNKVAMMSPEYELIKSDGPTLSTGRIVPVYSETKGLTSKWLRGRIAFLLETMLPTLIDIIPAPVITSRHLMPLREALQEIHFPSSLPNAEEARKRLAFDELYFLQLQSYFQKHVWEKEAHAPPCILSEQADEAFLHALPFTLTDDQLKVKNHITSDMKRPVPMNRLLEGDVGSGKTVLAAYAMYVAYQNGYQSVLLAPTQILAEQHYKTIQSLLAPFSIPISLVIGNRKNLKSQIPMTKQSNSTLKTTNQEPGTIFIGTHALLEESVTMKNLGLVIIDEQQRFGVRQRALLRKKSDTAYTPHVLTMTATPIPRTIALTLYGHLDLSTLETMPHGRIPITTWVVPKEKRSGAYEWIRTQIKETHCRAFIVCPFIEESESMTTVKAAKKEFETLTTDIFPDMKLGLLHGKMKGSEKTAILDDFRTGKTQILVSTPVVEVGIDIPEASIMLIETSDRFGLSQLHQLRGRVGRGNQKSYCLLFTEVQKPETIKRLKIMETVTRGPKLAEYDLELRGEGDVFGTRQHGIPSLALASLSDRGMIEDIQHAVKELIDKDPDLTSFPLLREKAEKGTIQDISQD